MVDLIHAGPAPRRALSAVAPVPHGAPSAAELAQWGQRPGTVIDFSTNVNPYGPSPWVQAAMARAAVDRYPDSAALELRRALADRHEIAPDQMVVANGSVEIFWLVALAFLEPGSSVLILGPTFGEYRRAALLMGADVHEWRANEAHHFAVEPLACAQELGRRHPDVVFLCNPNNPTGQAVDAEAIRRWVEADPKTLFVVDEAYVEFAPRVESLLAPGMNPPPNLLIVRSLTKSHGLPGLRLGYAVGQRHLVDVLDRVRPPWSVNCVAQAAGLAALRDEEHLRRTLQRIAAAGEQLGCGLRELGFRPVPSVANYFLVPAGDGRILQHRLARQGLIVRDCASFGLPAYVRIAVRRPEENRLLLQAWETLIVDGSRESPASRVSYGPSTSPG